MSAQQRRLTITGGDDWIAEDLTDLIRTIYILYNRAVVLNFDATRSAKSLLSQLGNSKRRVRLDDKLVIDSLVIQSPMKLDFRGSGELLKEVRMLIKDLTGGNKLERQAKIEELMHQKAVNSTNEINENLKLLEKALRLARETNASEEEQRKIISAILLPASEAADIVSRKGLIISEELSDQESDFRK